jgi:hypothetical protein
MFIITKSYLYYYQIIPYYYQIIPHYYQIIPLILRGYLWHLKQGECAFKNVILLYNLF